MKILFSILIPVYQNELNLEHTIPKLLSLSEGLPEVNLKLVFVNDGSTDKSATILNKFTDRFPNQIKTIHLTRNFGQTAAIQAGLSHVEGDCVGIISADLQDPYELFIEMFSHWKDGHKFVIGERYIREEGFIHQFVSGLYSKLVRALAIKDFPKKGYDFCLLDRLVVDQIKKLHEKNTSIFVLLFWLGFTPKRILITRSERKLGKSQWNLLKKINFTIDTIIAFTRLPIRSISILSLLMTLFACLVILYVVILRVLYGVVVPGWATITALISIFSSVIMLSLSMIGEYVWRLLDEQRKRPPYVIENIYTQELNK